MATHDDPVQGEPIQQGSGEADDESRLSGLMTQVRADYQLGSAADARVLLRQRLDDAGIQVSADTFEELVERVTA